MYLLRDKLCLGWNLVSLKGHSWTDAHRRTARASVPLGAKNKLHPFSELKMTQQSVADVVKKKAPSHSFSNKKQITIRKVNYKYSHLLSIYRMSQTLRGKGENRPEDSCLLLTTLKSMQTIRSTVKGCTTSPLRSAYHNSQGVMRPAIIIHSPGS